MEAVNGLVVVSLEWLAAVISSFAVVFGGAMHATWKFLLQRLDKAEKRCERDRAWLLTRIETLEHQLVNFRRRDD